MYYQTTLFKVIVTIIILIISFQQGHCVSQQLLSLKEKVQDSKLIVLATCIGVDEEQYAIYFNDCPGRQFSGIRYGSYEIKEVLKGNYWLNFIQIDYKLTSETYPPFINGFTAYPLNNKLTFNPVKGEYVFLFIEQDSIIQFGIQGKVIANESTDKSFRKIVADVIEQENAWRDKVVEKIFKNLESDDWQIKCKARSDLNKIDTKKYGLRIANLLETDDDHLINAALNALHFTTDTLVVPFVLPILYHEKAHYRSNAVKVLGEIPKEMAFTAIMELYNDPEPSVRGHIISELNGQYNAVKRLPYYEETGLIPMRGWGDDKGIYWDNGKETLEVYRGYAQYVNNYESILISLFYDAATDSNAFVRKKGLQALRGISNKHSKAILIKALYDDDKAVRKTAALSLAAHLDQDAVNPLGEFICRDTTSVRLSAIYSLRMFVDSGYVDASAHHSIVECLRELFFEQDDTHYKGSILYILGMLEDPEIISLIPEFLDDDDNNIRYAALRIVQSSKNPDYIPLLNKILQDETDPDKIKKLKYTINYIRNLNK